MWQKLRTQILYNGLPKISDSILFTYIANPLSRADESVGSHGNLSLLFLVMKKAMGLALCEQVTLSLLRLCLHSLLSSYLQIVSVEISLQFHTLHQRGMDLQMLMHTTTAQCMLAVFAHNWLCYYWQGTNDSALLSHMLQSRHLHERKEQELGNLLAWKEEQKLRSMRLHHQST